MWHDIARVLKPGGRVAVSDMALLQPLPTAVAATLDTLVECVAGPPLVAETERMMREAGLVDIALEPKLEYVQAMACMQHPFYETIVAHLPEGTTPGLHHEPRHQRAKTVLKPVVRSTPRWLT